MSTCPHCDDTLRPALLDQDPDGVLMEACPYCLGRVVNLGSLRQEFDHKTTKELWLLAYQQQASGELDCPHCARPMARICLPLQHSAHPTSKLELDVCKPCQCVWFDHEELNRLPGKRKKTVLPAEARAAINQFAYYRDIEMREQALAVEVNPDVKGLVLDILDLPIPDRKKMGSHSPFASFIVFILLILIGLWSLFHRRSIAEYGFIAADPWRGGGLTLLSSFFVHGSSSHLLGNFMIYAMFAPVLESFIGFTRFLLLLMAASLAGLLFHAMAAINPAIPVVGASAGISGLITAFALMLPDNRVSFFWTRQYRRHVGDYPRQYEFRIPAFWLLVFWICLQVFEALKQSLGISHISAWAHLGGAAVGVGFWWLDRYFFEYSAKK